MKNEKLFHETIDILVKAYLNETLIHSDCSACAVGNLVAYKHYGYYGIIKDNDLWMNNWSVILCGHESERGLAEINSTGYTVNQIILIEKAFESVVWGSGDRDGYKGLMAVVEVLCKIHECEEVKEYTKALFVK